VTRADDGVETHSVENVVQVEGDDDAPLVRAFQLSGGGPHLGVSLSDVGSEEQSRLKLGDARGALVTKVHADTPAAKAGLKADDLIVRFDGEAVRSAAHLSRLVRETPAGRTVAIEVNRGGATQRLSATLDTSRRFGFSGDSGDFSLAIPPVPPMPPIPPLEPLIREKIDGATRHMFIERPGRLGITFQELSGQLARYFKVEDGSLLVSDVDADSAAAKAGLKAGDVIVAVNGKPVTRGQELREQVAKADDGAQIALGVQREGKPLDLKVTVTGRSRARREPTI
jgi:serine protease Do